MANAIEVKVPDIGDFKNIPVIEVLVKPGDTIKKEDSLVTLESDKSTMDVPSPAAGVVKDVRLKVGDKVSAGALVLTLEAGDAAPSQPAAAVAAPVPAAPQPAKSAAPQPTEAKPAPAAAPAPAASPVAVDEGGFGKSHASPSVRRFARELGVDLSRVKGSGPKERVLKDDVQEFVKAELSRPAGAAAGGGLGFNLPPMQPVDFAKFGPVTSQPLSRIQKLSGGFLHRTCDDLRDPRHVERLNQVFKRSCINRSDSGVEIAKGGHHHDRHVAGEFPQRRQRCQAILSRQADVEQDALGAKPAAGVAGCLS